MKTFDKKKWLLAAQLLLTVLFVGAIAALFPRYSTSFKYHFEVGKPWGYGLVTAEFDFPIYKTEKQLSIERHDILAGYTPYFKIDDNTTNRQLASIARAASAQQMSEEGSKVLLHNVRGIYEQGILDAEDAERLKDEHVLRIRLIDSRRQSKVRPVAGSCTPRTAYDRILAQTHLGQHDESALHALALNRYLVPNLTYDTITSRKAKEKLLSSISLTQGKVQAGEKIIDRGEIVTEQSYQLLSSLRHAYSDQQIHRDQSLFSIFGNIILICFFITLLGLYLYVFRRNLLQDFKTILFFCILMTIILAMTALMVRFTNLSLYLIPFAWLPVIIRVFYDARTALYVHMITIMIASFMVPAPFEFVVIQVSIGMVAVSSLKDMAQRAQLAQTAGWIVGCYALAYTAFSLASNGDWHALDWRIYGYIFCNGIFIVFAYGLIYILEKLFGLVSSITLVELTNVNTGLLMDFAEQAPGSFQHSLQVSNLATDAAKAIGANSLLVRTGALYHDIGKMAHPELYTENQQGGPNPLLSMNHMEAARTITGHVEDGIRLAHKYKLPDVIIQFIATHHGTSKVKYFYNSYVNEHPGESVDESLFMYAGPKPNTKETAILMMADAIEARSRSLGDYSDESIRLMVNQMIDAQIQEGQLSETPLSFKDVEDIKAVFVARLAAINHHRIAYPTLQKSAEDDNKKDEITK